jgi:hypothetical protein
MLRLCIDGSVEGILFIFSSTFPLFKSSVMKSLYRFWCRRFSVCTSMLEMERIEFYPNRIDPSWMAVWKMLFPWWSIYSTVVSLFLNLRHKLKTNQMITNRRAATALSSNCTMPLIVRTQIPKI